MNDMVSSLWYLELNSLTRTKALREHDAPKVGRRMTHDNGSDVQPGILGAGPRPILPERFALQGIRELSRSFFSRA